MTVYYHTTDSAHAILHDGFRDGEGSYLLEGLTLRGVFIADVPIDCNGGAVGDELLMITLPGAVSLDEYEIIEEEKPYREWCVPAELLNSRGRVELMTEEDADRARGERWGLE